MHSHQYTCVCLSTTQVPVDLQSWNSYADSNFVFYDQSLVRKLTEGDQVCLEVVNCITMSDMSYIFVSATHVHDLHVYVHV